MGEQDANRLAVSSGDAAAEDGEAPGTRESWRWDGVLTALAPIHHGGEGQDGTVTPFAVQKMVQPDGETLDVPRISGNSIRGQWRRIAAALLLESADLGEGSIAPAAFYFLFSGGALTKAERPGAQYTDLAALDALARRLPMAGLFGGGVGATLLPGSLHVGFAVPLCRETAHLVPAAYRERCTASIWALRDEQYFSRQDDRRLTAGRRWLAAAVDAAPARTRRQPSGQARDDDEAAAEDLAAERGTAQQMRYGRETLAAGTAFWHSFSLHGATAAERAVLEEVLARWAEAPRLGGQGATGFGAVAADYAPPRQLGRRAALADDPAAIRAALAAFGR